MSPPQPPASTTAWHALEAGEALAHQATTEQGLSAAEALERLAHHGPNRLPPPRRRGALRRLLAQFHNVLIYVLLGAGAVTTALGHWVDAAVIFGVVVVNALVGFLQEGKAERALEAVRGLLSPQSTVLRDGRRQVLPAEALVPGDIVVLQSGDRVPADLRLLRVRELRVDESMLTGESVPVQKSGEAVPAGAVIGDRHGMAFSGTLVSSGQATGVVVATGPHTELGRISALIAGVRTVTTPLLRQISDFGRTLTAIILALAGATFAFGTLVRDYAAGEMFLAAVGLAVAAIPEGLPAIITITLAIGVQRMARRNAVVRRLPAVETLGSVTVICSDKTGTLTRNEMTVQAVVTAAGSLEVGGAGYAPRGGFSSGGLEVEAGALPDLLALCQAGALCNEAALEHRSGEWRVHGDPTEGALLSLALKAGLEGERLGRELPRTDTIPFESEHRLMATLHHDHAGHGFIYVKGAPEAVLVRCRAERHLGEDRPLDPQRWHRQIETLASRGQRTLALAECPAGTGQRALRFEDIEGGLTLLGVVGIMDPPREEAVAAVARCQAAGIRVKMITGDHAGTASAIAGAMGIGRTGRTLTGDRLEAMDSAALTAAAGEVDVFARTSPEHKLRLVLALQAQGEVVAMTGDGVNDAPALKRADVGVAMGIKGTEAAKEAAEMVLADDNFTSIAHAVEEGRTIYDNIRKSILFILPTNGGEALVVLSAIALGRMLPLTPAQILWVNMITAVTLALALAFEPPEADVMGRPPRNPRSPILDAFMAWRVVFVSLILVTGTFGLFLWEREHGAGIEEARTVAVNTLVMFEAFYLLSTRRLGAPVLSLQGLRGNPYVLLAIALVMVFQLLFTYAPPMQALFHSAPLDAGTWGRMLLVTPSVLLLVEAEKWLLARRRAGWPAEGTLR